MNQLDRRETDETYKQWVADAFAFIQVVRQRTCPVDNEDHLIVEYGSDHMTYRCPASGHQVTIPRLVTTNLYTTLQNAEDQMNLILREVEQCILTGRRTKLGQLQKDYQMAQVRYHDMQHTVKAINDWDTTINLEINEHQRGEMLRYYERQTTFQSLDTPIDPELRRTILLILKNEGAGALQPPTGTQRLATLSKQFRQPVSYLVAAVAWLTSCIEYAKQQAIAHVRLHEYRRQTERIPIYMTQMIDTVPHKIVTKEVVVNPTTTPGKKKKKRNTGGSTNYLDDLDDSQTLNIDLDDDVAMNDDVVTTNDDVVVVEESGTDDVKVIQISQDQMIPTDPINQSRNQSQNNQIDDGDGDDYADDDNNYTISDNEDNIE